MDKMNLCIDIGNTSTKAALYQHGQEIRYLKPFALDTYKELENEFNRLHVLVCKTGENVGLEAYITETKGESAFLNPETKLPISLNYKTPHTLGRDRIATAVAAHYLDKEATWLVIDLGTCLTLDLVYKGCFEGGLISPGVNMRLKAMNQFAAGLPLVEYDYNVTFPGKNTSESLQVGVCRGIEYEINGHIGQLNARYEHLRVVDCSSIQLHFVKEVKNKIFARPKLVLEGLNHIIEYNAKK